MIEENAIFDIENKLHKLITNVSQDDIVKGHNSGGDLQYFCSMEQPYAQFVIENIHQNL